MSGPRIVSRWAQPPDQTSLLGNLIRATLIGLVEIIPGITGGTVALVVGNLPRAHRIRLRAHSLGTVPGQGRRDEAREYWGNISWRLLIPPAIGMVAAFVLVPLIMVRDDVSYRGKKLGVKHLIFFIIAAIVTFIVLSLRATLALEPHWYTNMLVVETLDLGYIAVCGAGLSLGAAFVLIMT